MGLLNCILPNPAIFVIITRGRSGSNFLLSLLSSHPMVWHCGEVVGESRLRKVIVKAAIKTIGTVPYVKSCIGAITARAAASMPYIKGCLKEKEFVLAIGMKILYYQVEGEYARKYGLKDLHKLLEFLRTNKAIKVIHLKRRNRLRTLVSIKKALNTGQYLLHHEKGQVKEVQIELSPDECKEEFERTGSWERKYDTIFQKHEMLEAFYEDLVSNTDQECYRILTFLGVGQQCLRARTLRQNLQGISQVVSNYKELKRHFRGTEWEAFFED